MASLYTPPLSFASFPVTGRTHHSNSSFIHSFRNHNSIVTNPGQYFNFRVSCKANPKGNVNIGMFNRTNVLFGSNDLDPGTLGFVDIPARVARQRFGVCAAQATDTPNYNVKFPFILDSIVCVVVERPKKLMTNKRQLEELVIEGIEFDKNTLIKFDVLVKAEDCPHLIEANHAEYAGTFFNVPCSPHPGRGNTRTNLVLSFTHLLIELKMMIVLW